MVLLSYCQLSISCRWMFVYIFWPPFFISPRFYLHLPSFRQTDGLTTVIKLLFFRKIGRAIKSMNRSICWSLLNLNRHSFRKGVSFARHVCDCWNKSCIHCLLSSFRAEFSVADNQKIKFGGSSDISLVKNVSNWPFIEKIIILWCIAWQRLL